MKLTTLIGVVGLGFMAYAVGWPMAKDVAVEQVQAHPAQALKSAGVEPEMAKVLTELALIGNNLPGVKAAVHQQGVADLESQPLDRQIQFVINALLM
jgi:hypothetical protein